MVFWFLLWCLPVPGCGQIGITVQRLQVQRQLSHSRWTWPSSEFLFRCICWKPSCGLFSLTLRGVSECHQRPPPPVHRLWLRVCLWVCALTLREDGRTPGSSQTREELMSLNWALQATETSLHYCEVVTSHEPPGHAHLPLQAPPEQEILSPRSHISPGISWTRLLDYRELGVSARCWVGGGVRTPSHVLIQEAATLVCLPGDVTVLKGVILELAAVWSVAGPWHPPSCVHVSAEVPICMCPCGSHTGNLPAGV